LSKTNKEAIKLATGEQGSATQYQEFNGSLPHWSIRRVRTLKKNLGGIKFDFANPIDTLNNGIKKTILLKSSQYSKKIGAPVEINLILLLKKQVLITTLNLGIFRFYCWKDPFIPCLKTGSYYQPNNV
jgi:hypothetical protein